MPLSQQLATLTRSFSNPFRLARVAQKALSWSQLSGGCYLHPSDTSPLPIHHSSLMLTTTVASQNTTAFNYSRYLLPNEICLLTLYLLYPSYPRLLNVHLTRETR